MYSLLLFASGVQWEHQGADVRDVPTRTKQKTGRVECDDGTVVECDECVWCTNAGAQAWLQETVLGVRS